MQFSSLFTSFKLIKQKEKERKKNCVGLKKLIVIFFGTSLRAKYKLTQMYWHKNSVDIHKRPEVK